MLNETFSVIFKHREFPIKGALLTPPNVSMAFSVNRSRAVMICDMRRPPAPSMKLWFTGNGELIMKRDFWMEFWWWWFGILSSSSCVVFLCVVIGADWALIPLPFWKVSRLNWIVACCALIALAPHRVLLTWVANNNHSYAKLVELSSAHLIFVQKKRLDGVFKRFL